MTTEQKAHSYASSHEIDVPQLFHYLYNAFLAGASSVQAGGCRWVKCKDRLPEKDGLYLIVQNSPGSCGRHEMFFKTEDKKWYWQPNPYSVCGDGFITEWLSESPSSSDVMGDDAISFAEWVDNRATRNDETGLWIHCLFEPNEPITSQQLYELFKQRK